MDTQKYYEFCTRVKTISGHNSLEEIPQALMDLNAKSPMIITDKGVSAVGLIQLVQDAIKKSKNKIEIKVIFDDVPADSDITTVNEIAKLYKEKGCDSIITVGGGSPMDTAKGVNILVSEDADDLMQFTGAGAIKRRLNPLIAIPTTSGTGSEMTLVAVIADHSKNKKMAFTSYFLLPDVAILDSRMTLTLPDFLTAPTAMDALTHACEAYTCLAKNPLSDSAALVAIELIRDNLLNVIKKPKDANGRLALANASALAGIAFSNSMVGMVHTIGHAIGGVCHVPHGVAMSILLPYGLEYNLHKTGHLIGELLLPLAGSEIFATTSKELRPLKSIEIIRQLNEDLHKATGGRHSRFLSEVRNREGTQMIPKDKIRDIALTAQNDGSIFYNPEELDLEDLIMVIEAAWEGVPIDRKKIKMSKEISKVKIKI